MVNLTAALSGGAKEQVAFQWRTNLSLDSQSRCLKSARLIYRLLAF